MSYFAHLSLYPPPADGEPYKKLASELAAFGLYDALVGDSKNTAKLPRGTFAGEFEGEDPTKVKTDLGDKVQAVLDASGLEGMMFLSVGGVGWTWRRSIFP